MDNGLGAMSGEKNLYTFYSAKKLYLAHLPQKYILMEKKNEVKGDQRVLSLVSRNPVIINKKNGMLLFPRCR